uniref:Uncharacterized protein n=1 Tax=Clytia hemisphaerica TaxID=252671 RepID=A0A7M6DRJ9_9CNID
DDLKRFHRHRTIMCWHDTSGIINSSHFLVMFSTVYDAALFLTDDEFFEIAGYRVSVQAMVEKPVTYILARCPASALQLCYGNERLEDYIRINNQPYIFSNGISFKDKMRFFKGDAPACQLEAGQQKGGNHFCWHCPMKASRGKDLAHLLNCERQTVQERIDKLTMTHYGRQSIVNGIVNPAERITKPDIIGELHEREVKFTKGENKDVLKG